MVCFGCLHCLRESLRESDCVATGFPNLTWTALEEGLEIMVLMRCKTAKQCMSWQQNIV